MEESSSLTRRGRTAEVIIDVLPSRIPSFLATDIICPIVGPPDADHRRYNTARSLPSNCSLARARAPRHFESSTRPRRADLCDLWSKHRAERNFFTTATKRDEEERRGKAILERVTRVAATKGSRSSRRLYLDKKSIKVLRDQENAHSATFPQSPENRWHREIGSIIARIRQRMFRRSASFPRK